MGAITIAGLPCSSARLIMPTRGTWTADVALAKADSLVGTQVLQIGQRKLTGTVVRAAAYGGTTRARLVGGYAGWRKLLPTKSYSHLAGLKKSTIIGDAAREAGEKLGVVAQDGVIGALWVREGDEPAERTIGLLASDWYVDDAGVTQIQSRPATPIASVFTVSDRKSDAGRVEVATEVFQDWTPGRTFVSPTTPDVQTISLVTIDATDGSAPRVSVLTGPSTQDRMLDDFRKIVHQELGEMLYAGMWTYKIVSGDDKTVTATPVKAPKRIPAIKDCPMLPGLLGEGVTPKPDSLCYVVFADLDPSQPFVVHIIGNALKASISATVLTLNGGAQPIARVGDTVMGIFAITSGNPTIQG